MSTSLEIVRIQTPKKFLLDGVWYGSSRAKRVFIFIHGLGGSLFGFEGELARSLVDQNSAALVFNNRGMGIINGIKKLNPKKKKGYERVRAGKAHEVFTDCVDDIEGAVQLARSRGAKEIYLVGHSTGCQKSVYYLSKKTHSFVRGAVLLAPISDYASTVAETAPAVLARAVAYARKQVKARKPHELLPDSLWPDMYDAQRFLSLYTPESKEEVFSYAMPKKRPTTLQKVHVPLLVVIGSHEEYADRPVEQIIEWFQHALPGRKVSTKIIAGATHSFTGYVSTVKKALSAWVKN